MKITTADCVAFLVKCAADFHPTMADTHETPEEYAALSDEMKKKSSHALLTNPKMWKRMKKCGPKDYWKNMGFGDNWNAWSHYNPPMKEEDIKAIRHFANGPNVSEDMDYDYDDDGESEYMPGGGLAGHNERHYYEVYEMKDGTLILGDNLGD